MRVVQLAPSRERKSNGQLGGDTDEYSQCNPEDVNKVTVISRDTIWHYSPKRIVCCPHVSEVGTKIQMLSSSIHSFSLFVKSADLYIISFLRSSRVAIHSLKYHTPNFYTHSTARLLACASPPPRNQIAGTSSADPFVSRTDTGGVARFHTINRLCIRVKLHPGPEK